MPTEVQYKSDAQIKDTIDLIVKIINQCYPTEFISHLVKKLGPVNCDENFLRRVFDFVAQNITYIDDPTRTGIPDHESVWQPATTILEQQGDCKKMTVLIACILKNAGIEPLLKHVYYEREKFTHIYVIVPWPQLPKYITVDPVNDKKFNKEVQYSHGNIFDLKGNKKMDLYMGNKPTAGNSGKYGFKEDIGWNVSRIDADLYGSARGIPGTALKDQNAVIEELFAVDGYATMGKKTKEERKENRKKAKDKFLNVGLAIPRGAFLLLVDLNALKMADKLALGYVRDPNSVNNLWTKLGGKTDKLIEAIKKGSGQNIRGIGVVVATTVAATIATATPVLIAVQELLKKLKAAGTDDEQRATDDAIDQGADDVASGKTPINSTATHVTTAHARADQGGTIPPTPNSILPPFPPAPTAGGDFANISLWTRYEWINAVLKTPIYFTAFTITYLHAPIFFFTGIAVVIIGDFFKVDFYKTIKNSFKNGKVSIYRTR